MLPGCAWTACEACLACDAISLRVLPNALRLPIPGRRTRTLYRRSSTPALLAAVASVVRLNALKTCPGVAVHCQLGATSSRTQPRGERLRAQPHSVRACWIVWQPVVLSGAA